MDEMDGCGSYRILNLVNGMMYVGSTAKSFKERWRDHRVKLKRGKSHNSGLQSDWIQYGMDSFSFEIIEATDPRDSHDAEQRLIDSVSPELLYNVHVDSRGPTGVKRSDETKKRMSASSKGRKKSPEEVEKMRIRATGKKASEETRRKMPESRKGRKVSEETKAKISASHMGMGHTQETREKLSKANKGKVIPREVVEAIAAKLRGSKQSPEVVARRVATRKRNWILKENQCKD